MASARRLRGRPAEQCLTWERAVFSPYHSPTSEPRIKVHFKHSNGDLIKTVEDNEGDDILSRMILIWRDRMPCSTCHVILLVTFIRHARYGVWAHGLGRVTPALLDGITCTLPSATRNMFVDGSTSPAFTPPLLPIPVPFMGRNNKNEHLEDLLVQKDQQIAALETQVQAYIARTSVLQSRLLSTLDTLDVIQSSQNDELHAMAQTTKLLKDKLVWYSTVVRSAEMERDDMRDAVLKLVEKVELSNDYSMWPHSQIRLSSLAGSPIFPSLGVQPSESDLLLHATTMIESLRRERDLERKAHAQTRDLAQARLVALAAQLSRREAELESFISSTAHTSAIQPRQHSIRREPLTTEQVISALDATLARNKMLEMDVKGLFKRLEEARLAASNLEGPPPPPPPPSGGLQQQPFKSAISPQHTPLQSASVPVEPTVCEDPLPNGALDQTLVLPNPNYQVIQDLERQIKILGTKIDALAEARRSMTETLRTDMEGAASHSVETRLVFLENENDSLRLSNRSLRDELDAVRISAQARETELLDEIQSLRSNQQPVLEEGNNVYNLLEPDIGEISMELATPLQPTRMMLDVNNNTHDTPYLDPLFVPLPPSPDNHPL